MRIRKNARVVVGGGSSASSSSSSSSFLVCQLNRSPWDVIDAFSLQGDGDDGFGLNANGSSYLVNSIPPSHSLPCGESMELSFEYVEKPPPVPQPPKRERENDEIAGLEEDMNGWRFELNERIPPAPLPLPPPPPKKVELPPAPPAPKRRGRPRKPTSAAAAVAAAANPYEFYYYSGFGPQWGKRRGGDKSSSLATTAAKNHECEDINARLETPGSSSTTQMMSEDEEDFHDDDDNNNNNNDGKMKMKMKWRNKDNGVDMLDSVADGELDYIEDDEDDEDERELYGSGRRARKPIKARSLKSLM